MFLSRHGLNMAILQVVRRNVPGEVMMEKGAVRDRMMMSRTSLMSSLTRMLAHAWQCWPMHDRAQCCTTVQPGSARTCMAVLAYARQCLNHARPCKLASAGPKQGSAGPNGGSAGHDDLRTTVPDTSTFHLISSGWTSWSQNTFCSDFLKLSKGDCEGLEDPRSI
ncbi:hypothetical protein E3N88_23219 [Mikania micrantha]|uniref:Uncharacterized protein n=1 Tax=Mikania micrantha TaxID=192012 RepID=A0A5N6NFC6_9ASTR|nr:hypothetical protein E3N88_23219 [Mikania micrantha]